MSALLDAWRRGARPWLGLLLGVTTVVVSVILHSPRPGASVWRWGDVYASLPLVTELRRIPMSFFLPTPYLPPWAAVGQIVVVVGIGEMVLNRWWVVGTGLAGHLASTLATRAALQWDQGALLALPHVLAHSLDTGPSAAVTAVGMGILVGRRLHRLAALLFACLVCAAVIAPGIDGLEHLVALVCGAAAGLAYALAHRSGPDDPTVAGSGTGAGSSVTTGVHTPTCAVEPLDVDR